MDSRFILRFIKLQKLWNITLFSSNNLIETYIANIRIKSKDLKRMGVTIDSQILIALLLNNLNGKYKDFIYRLIIQLDDIPNFNKIVTLLYKEERLLKRDTKEIAIIATVKRFQKKQKEKKKGNINSNLDYRGRNIGQGRNRSNNNNNNTGLRPLKYLSSTNYKGNDDAPKCSKYLLLPSKKKRKH